MYSILKNIWHISYSGSLWEETWLFVYTVINMNKNAWQGTRARGSHIRQGSPLDITHFENPCISSSCVPSQNFEFTYNCRRINHVTSNEYCIFCIIPLSFLDIFLLLEIEFCKPTGNFYFELIQLNQTGISEKRSGYITTLNKD